MSPAEVHDQVATLAALNARARALLAEARRLTPRAARCADAARETRRGEQAACIPATGPRLGSRVWPAG